MTLPRFALSKLMPLLGKGLEEGGKFAWRTLKPANAMEAAIRYGPDVFLWPAIAGGMAPEGTGMGGRAALAAEDAFIGIGASALGQLAGGGIGHRLAKMKRFKDNKDLLSTAITVGDLSAGPLNIIAPRPVMNKVYGDANLGQEELVRKQIQAEEREKYEALINLLGGGAGVAAKHFNIANVG